MPLDTPPALSFNNPGPETGPTYVAPELPKSGLTHPSHKYPSDLFGSKYGRLFCLITVLDTYSVDPEGSDRSNTIKLANGASIESLSDAASKFKNEVTAIGDNVNDGLTPRNAANRSRIVVENIFLPMPLSLSTNYGVSYDDSFSHIEESKNIGSSVGSSLMDAAKLLFPKTMAFGNLLSSVAVPALKIAGAVSGLAMNPHKELLFNGVKFREFKLKYKLIAKSKSESDTINNIIKVFEKYMHPTLAAGSLLYRYPAEFEIRFYTSDGSGKQNKFIYKIYRCVLQNYNVSYGGNNFAVFKNQDGTTEGAPIEIEIELDFKETNPLTREFIEKINADNKSSIEAELSSS